MSLAALLTQSLVIERAAPAVVAGTPPVPVLDAYGQPVLAWTTLATVAGSVQPKSAQEVVLLSQGGAASTDTTIYVAPTDVTPADRIRLATDTSGPYYAVTGVRDAAGRGHHLELDCRVIR